MNRSEHLLTIVAEEAVEVAQRATKALRFGLDEVQPGQQLSNLQRLMGEVYDLLGSLEMLHRAAGRHMGIDLDAVEAKKAKVEKFLAYSLELGTLQADHVRAFEIADEAMFELLLAHGALHGNGVDSTVIGFTDEAAAEVMSLAEASEAMRGAFEWLKDRGYVELDRDGNGEFISVIRRPGEDT